MSDDSLNDSPHNLQSTTHNSPTIHIPIEIVSEEEMAFLEAALMATRSSLPSCSSIPSICFPSLSSQFQKNSTSIHSITPVSKRALSCCSQSDIEDLGDTQKRSRVTESFLQRFRSKRGLSVTDITAMEWCEKQMEFTLLSGKRNVTKAMKAGSARHAKLEEEVVKKVDVDVKSVEDGWALRFLNFITGVNQLLFEGLTRELPLVNLAEGVWMVGVIDEIRLPMTATSRYPVLVDTKTRGRATLPAEPQKRNGRLQLMLYKYLWDSLVGDNFPSIQFFDFFSLDPQCLLSEDIQLITTNSGFTAKTLHDVVEYYKNTCSMLPPANAELLLRYELQRDNSVLGEDYFTYDHNWLKSNLKGALQIWLGEREASTIAEEEQWKCHYCRFVSKCSTNQKLDSSSLADKTN